jgi:hypothetical protein
MEVLARPAIRVDRHVKAPGPAGELSVLLQLEQPVPEAAPAQPVWLVQNPEVELTYPASLLADNPLRTRRGVVELARPHG